jgi:hypothetical protein
MPLVRTVRKRYFLAVEGESEQSFVKWLQTCADENGLSVHLQCRVLSGGGFRTMLRNAAIYRDQERRKGHIQAAFLILDEDRAYSGDWPIEQLRRESQKEGFILCGQKPNFEGLLIRMHPGRERTIAVSVNVDTQLLTLFPSYKKPIDANTLCQRFTLNDLMRVARFEVELMNMLSAIGFQS